jgi:endoglucanase
MKNMFRFLALMVFICISANLLMAQWVQVNNFSGAITCFAVSSTNFFAGTEGGGVFLSTNNGTSWNAVNAGLTDTSVHSLSVSGTNLFAGTNGGVFFSTNNGTSWTAVNTGLTETIGGDTDVCALVVSGSNLFAGTDGGGVLLSSDNGVSWTAVNSGLTNPYVLSLAVSGANLFAGTSGGGVFLSTDNGTSWTKVNTGLPGFTVVLSFAVFPDGAGGTNLFAGTYGGIFLSTNNGTSWTASGLTNTVIRAFAVSPASGGTGGTNLFAGTEGGVFLSTNNGTSWSAVNTGLTNTIVSTLAISGTDIFAGTQGGGVWRRPLSEMVTQGTLHIVVDGLKDDFYNALTSPNDGYLQIRSYAYNDIGAPINDADLSAKVWTTWDNQWFYLYEEVIDDTLSGNAAEVWNDDCLELKIDPQTTDSMTNSVWDTRLTALGMESAGVVSEDSMNYVPDSLKHWVRRTIPGGYALELAIKWSAIQKGSETITPAVDNIFGLAINQADNDGHGRQATIQWAAVLLSEAWETPKYLGTVKFLAENKLQFVPTNNMTSVNNPIPYDGSSYPQVFSQQPYSDIRLNQIGFYPSMPKLAIVKNASSIPFYVIVTGSTDTVFRGMLTSAQTWTPSQELVSRADFSDLRTPGTYRIGVPNLGISYPFDIKQGVHLDLAIGALKGFYYQRASMPLLPAFAGAWARGAGHPDTSVIIHPSAATSLRLAGSKISSPKGWYDAGDYNKYIVSSGISTYTILATYEHFPEFCNQLETNIPESGNGIPDILDEALWNVRWMLTMQDPNDGGVYHILTDPNFDAFEMPWQDTQTRYVIIKTTAATLDFAAVMAQAARITANFSSALPGFSDSCLQASLKAWRWARQNPTTYYNRSQINAYSPAINTGDYADGNVTDEFAWAATELFVTTAQDSFLTVASPLSFSIASIPNWQSVRTLGLYTLANYLKTINIDTNEVRTQLINLANSLCTSMNSSAYGVVMGANNYGFYWGSNAIAANQGIELLIAYRLTGDSTYLHAALSNLDYLLGRNGTTFCFVTGFGSHSPQHIHHRISASDGIVAPVPGLMAGGPNPYREDGVTTYPSTLPALAYTDDINSYASNEICITWNAPLVYLAIGLEAILSPNVLPTQISRDYIEQPKPERFSLFQNYPNPFNSSTIISYQLSVFSKVRLDVFDVLGREVATLVNEEKPTGSYLVQWNTEGLASGFYFYRIKAGNYIETKKLILLR